MLVETILGYVISETANTSNLNLKRTWDSWFLLLNWCASIKHYAPFGKWKRLNRKNH